jgi:hypothetical protein
MSSWEQTYDSVFFLSIGTLFFGFMTAALGYCLKSKCENFSVCCGLINVQRRVDLEVQEEMKQMEIEEHKQESKNNV